MPWFVENQWAPSSSVLNTPPLVPANTVPSLPTANDWIARSVSPLLARAQVFP